ncbi:MAG: hypothetical protein FJ291_32460 [Planctomycetes bacterium]|nr:hypothetical protein [Planctomycetota bacterium]
MATERIAQGGGSRVLTATIVAAVVAFVAIGVGLLASKVLMGPTVGDMERKLARAEEDIDRERKKTKDLLTRLGWSA